MVTLLRFTGTEDYPIFRVTDDALDGTPQISYELHTRWGLHKTFPTLEQAERFVAGLVAGRVVAGPDDVAA